MDRSRSYSRPSPSGNQRSPSPSTPRSTMPSRGRPVSSIPSSHHGSRSRSSSKSTSRSPSRRSHHHHQHHHHQHQNEHHQDHQHHGLFKNSASLIAGIGLATVLAHKVWPKGVVHGDEDEWASSPRSKHHHHHHHSSERHEHHHRRSSDAERIVDQARSTHGRGDVLYVEEVGPFRRGDNRRASLDPRSFERLERSSDERILREARSPRDERVRPAVLPYPETPYPGEKFYDPPRRRAPVPELIPVSR